MIIVSAFNTVTLLIACAEVVQEVVCGQEMHGVLQPCAGR